MLGSRGTERTARVVALIGEGKSIDAIALEARCSPAYVSQVKRKLYRASIKAGAVPPAAIRTAPRRAATHRGDSHGTPRPIADRLGPADVLVPMDGGAITVELAGDACLVAIHEDAHAAGVVRADRSAIDRLIAALATARDALPSRST